MREIKFRAWSKRKRLMYGSDCIDLLIHFNGEPQSMTLEGYVAGTYNTPKVEIMQSTGLNDKNGKEIYEGDICRFLARPEKDVAWKDAQILIGEVSWDDEDTGFFFATNNCQWPHIKFWFTEQVEVIGNIYENPELIKLEGK